MMGIDPTELTYTEADNPGNCQILLFDGRTPKYIEVHISGVNLCPAATCASPNGTYVLTQTSPIRWDYSDADRTMVVDLSNVDSWFNCIGHPGLQDLFKCLSLKCVDEFINVLVDCLPPNKGKDGTMKFYWGPGISP